MDFDLHQIIILELKESGFFCWVEPHAKCNFVHIDRLKKAILKA